MDRRTNSENLHALIDGQAGSKDLILEVTIPNGEGSGAGCENDIVNVPNDNHWSKQRVGIVSVANSNDGVCQDDNYSDQSLHIDIDKRAKRSEPPWPSGNGEAECFTGANADQTHVQRSDDSRQDPCMDIDRESAVAASTCNKNVDGINANTEPDSERKRTNDSKGTSNSLTSFKGHSIAQTERNNIKGLNDFTDFTSHNHQTVVDFDDAEINRENKQNFPCEYNGSDHEATHTENEVLTYSTSIDKADTACSENNPNIGLLGANSGGDSAEDTDTESDDSTTVFENENVSHYSTYRNFDGDICTDAGNACSLTDLNADLQTDGCRSLDDVRDSEEDDKVASRIDIHKVHKMRTRSSSSTETKVKRKESLEQRLKRRFTIQDEHTSEVTKRILAVLIKYSLFVFNFCSWVIAVATIGLGIWMRTDKTFLVTSDTEFYLDMPLMTCVGGSVTFIVAFLGCVGALRENLILLKVFFYVLTLILLGEIILTTAGLILYLIPEARGNFFRDQPEKILSSAIQSYMDDREIKEWVDNIQSEFKCCGVSHTDEGFRDWQTSTYFNCSLLNRSIYRCAVPTSCCIFEKGDRVNTMCGFDMTDKPLTEVRDYIYTRGCIIGFGEWLGNYHSLIIISTLTVIAMQFLAVLSAKLMSVRIRKRRGRWRVLQQSLSSNSGACVVLASRDL